MMDRFKYYNYLGFHNPYWKSDHQDEGLFIKDNISDLIYEDTSLFDYTALVELITYGYCLGDRTLVQGICKSPWLKKPNASLTSWDTFRAVLYNEKQDSHENIAINLFSLLRQELKEYIKSSTNIGILLTGGMDSRIVACVLKSMLEDGELPEKKITAFTWGAENSRDVVYAQKIASIYNWPWEHISVGLNQLKKNIDLSIREGCEFSPVHLHGMSQLANREDIDCYLAGSFGDSIGRAEYSGTHLLNLSPLKTKLKNYTGLLRNDLFSLCNKSLQDDLLFYRSEFKQRLDYQDAEVDRQGHYMRRMLNSCMSIIDRKIPIYQMFSAPNVYLYMWSLAGHLRNDNIYKIILEKYGGELLTIPWARTGYIYPHKEGAFQDRFNKNHHDYGKMIRENLLDFISSTIHDNYQSISKNFIDSKGVHATIKNMRKYPIKGQYLLESKLLHIACIVRFVREFEIDIDPLADYRSRAASSVKTDFRYKAKYLYKKLRS